MVDEVVDTPGEGKRRLERNIARSKRPLPQGFLSDKELAVEACFLRVTFSPPKHSSS